MGWKHTLSLVFRGLANALEPEKDNARFAAARSELQLVGSDVYRQSQEMEQPLLTDTYAFAQTLQNDLNAVGYTSFAMGRGRGTTHRTQLILTPEESSVSLIILGMAPPCPGMPISNAPMLSVYIRDGNIYLADSNQGVEDVRGFLLYGPLQELSMRPWSERNLSHQEIFTWIINHSDPEIGNRLLPDRKPGESLTMAAARAIFEADQRNQAEIDTLTSANPDMKLVSRLELAEIADNNTLDNG